MKRTVLQMVLLFAVVALFFSLTQAVNVQAESVSKPPAEEAGPSTVSLIAQLRQQTDGTVRISYHRETGAVRFIGTSSNQSIRQPANLPADASPEAAARGFLDTYGQLFGLEEQAEELTVMTERTLDDGRAVVRFQQRYEGIPIVGAELMVQVTSQRNIISANGELLSDLALETTPTIDAESARQSALAKVANAHGVSLDDLTASGAELWIYNPILLGSPGVRLNSLVWRLEVKSVKMAPIKELVLLDAQRGFVALNFNQIEFAKNRVVYDNENNADAGLPGTGPVRSEGEAATGISDVDNAYDYSGDTYDFFFDEHGRDSLDNAGMTLTSTVRFCESADDCPYANAFWDGTQMGYGEGFAAADDVVGHELTHGVTNFSSNLFYYYQSGAINESFSDVWGEFIDLSNTGGTDTAAVRWLQGEDVPEFGAVRNMKDPTQFDHPDRMGSDLYWCSGGDNGGVHINSGVSNKLAYLLTDGDTFNSQTVTGLGISKAADLYYEAQTNLLTSASDYADLYDAINQACTNLSYTTNECQQVQNALDAVEMDQAPTCVLTEAPVCAAGETVSNLFFDDIESGGGNWTAGSNSGTALWYVPGSDNPFGLGPYATSGVGNIWGPNQDESSDTYLAMNSDVTLSDNAYLHFKHAYGFDDDGKGTFIDGGLLEYSTDDGTTWNDAGSLITHNGYTGTLIAQNPLGAVSAFTADSYGYTASRADLSSLSGQDIRIRFRIGTNEVAEDYGWFIDDVRIYTCEPPTSVTLSELSGTAPVIWQPTLLLTLLIGGGMVQHWRRRRR